MALIVLRHATATDERADLSDEARYLTAAGRAEALAVGAALRARLAGSVALYTSPLVRAVQTAELALGPLGNEIRALELLRPDAPPRQAFAELTRALATVDHVVAVGHEPSMSALAALALGLSHHAAIGRAHALAISEQRLAWHVTP